MPSIEVYAPQRGHVTRILRGILEAGWRITHAPENGALSRNGQVVVMRRPGQQLKLRLFVYKVTESSRGRPEERRIEITSTYGKKLSRPKGCQDVVIGVDVDEGTFVGIDPRRIGYGGPTGNASSFFDRSGLHWKAEDEILVRPHSARLFETGIEYHAFMKRSCLAEYLQNVESIHTGKYVPRRILVRKRRANFLVSSSIAHGAELVVTEFSRVRSRRKSAVKRQLVKAVESGQSRAVRKAKLSRTEFSDLMKFCEENGFLGEQFVMEFERKRLRRLGKPDLAQNVEWVSQDYPFAGYDILSFERSGEKRLIEVKSTTGTGTRFPMTDNEWGKAVEAASSYCIYRVMSIRTDPTVLMVRNPAALEKTGAMKKVPLGWLVTASNLERVQ